MDETTFPISSGKNVSRFCQDAKELAKELGAAWLMI